MPFHHFVRQGVRGAVLLLYLTPWHLSEKMKQANKAEGEDVENLEDVADAKVLRQVSQDDTLTQV